MNDVSEMHKAGFVSIIGRPNVGKSTLMNQLVGERLSIITNKAQTTRHRIMGILNSPEYQIIYSDTPGVIVPKYDLQGKMMEYVRMSLEDGDIVLFVVDPFDQVSEEVQRQVMGSAGKKILIINKIDLADEEQLQACHDFWADKSFDSVLEISALKGKGLERILPEIIRFLPVHPPYFDKEALTDKTERFFASEIIREKIFLNYTQEVPYSTDVAVTEFLEDDRIIRIRAEIFVERQSQKGIIIGKGGESLKKVGIEARKDMEEFFQKKVHLETFVKVAENWRKSKNQLRRFGYN